MRHAILLVCVLACGPAAHPPVPSPPAAVSLVVPGPIVPATSLTVAATDSFGVALARGLGVSVQLVSSRTALDLVDSGADLIVTDRPAVIRYASGRSDFAVIALPWDRQYAFVSANALPVENVVDAVHADARRAAR